MIGWLEHPLVKWFLPLPMLAAVFPLIYWFFRGTWKSLEDDALALRRDLAAEGRVDYRPLLTLTLGAVILAMQEYYGQLSFYAHKIAPAIVRAAASGGDAHRLVAVKANLNLYAELYGRLWWGLTRIAGYLVPFLVWRFAYPRDSLRDMGLRVRGLGQHAWLYAFFVVVMVPILFVVSRQPDFGGYYPICSTAGRSWAEFLIWEAVYIGQFVALEMFFRGWWLRTTRSFGTGAIFSMIVPYCMIHFGKPYLEACAALIAGVVLGSLAMRTRSVWAGVAVHVTVALLMDILSLDRKGQLPSALFTGSGRSFHFPYWRAVIWLCWGLALVMVVVKAVRMWPAWRAAWAARRQDG